MPEAQQKMRVSEISNNSEITSRKECENKKALEFIEQVTSNPDEIQLKVLSEILTRSAQVEYLQRHGLAGRTDRLTFKKLVPVVKYEHLQPDINRIANGDNSPILCSHPISEFLTRFVVFIMTIIILMCQSLLVCFVLIFTLLKPRVCTETQTLLCLYHLSIFIV